MVVVNTKCGEGHAMVSKSLCAVRPCKHCGDMVSTVYDCDFGHYGLCCGCWVTDKREHVAASARLSSEVD